MINDKRIVPVQATDLLSLISTICALASVTVTKLVASGIGLFTVSSAATALLAAEPAKKINITNAVSSATIYFIADYDFDDIYLNGVAADVKDDVVADGHTLLKAVLDTGVVTVTKVGF